MEIDYSKLYNLKQGGSNPEKVKTETEIATENLEKEAYREVDYKVEAFQVYKEHQEAIKKSETLQCEILKGINKNEDITTLFLKACKVISLITGTKEFYTQIERDITK